MAGTGSPFIIMGTFGEIDFYVDEGHAPKAGTIFLSKDHPGPTNFNQNAEWVIHTF